MKPSKLLPNKRSMKLSKSMRTKRMMTRKKAKRKLKKKKAKRKPKKNQQILPKPNHKKKRRKQNFELNSFFIL